MGKHIKNDLLDAASKGAFILHDKLPKDGTPLLSPVSPAKNLMKAVDASVAALHELEKCSEVADIRANDYAGNTKELIVGKPPRDTEMNELIEGMTKGGNVNFGLMKEWTKPPLGEETRDAAKLREAIIALDKAYDNTLQRHSEARKLASAYADPEQNKPLVDFIDAIYEQKKPDLAALKKWVEGQRTRAA